MTAPSYMPAIVPEPGRHPVETLLATIERYAGEQGWDGPNRLYMLDRVPLGIGVKEFPFSGELAELGKMHPAVLCGLFAAHFRQSGTAALGDGWLGFALAVETWGIVSDLSEPVAAARDRADSAARRLHQRPDRIEARMVMLAITDWAAATYTRQRGTGVGGVDECSYMAQLVPGEVGDALRRLVDDVATLRGTS